MDWNGIHPERRLIFDTAIDAAVFGPAFRVTREYKNIAVHLHGATPDMRSKNTTHMCDAATVIQLDDGKEYIIEWNGGINCTKTEGQESLLLPLQAQLFHHEVDLTQLHVGGKQRVVADGIILPIDSNGVQTFWKGRCPSTSDLKNIPTIRMTSSIGWDPSKLTCLANIERKTWNGDYDTSTAISKSRRQEHVASAMSALEDILEPRPLPEEIYKDKITWNDDYGKNTDGTKRICLNDLNLGIIPPNADELDINKVNSDSDEDDNVHTPNNVATTAKTDGKSKDKHELPALLDLPMRDIVSNKTNKKISKEIPPQRTHVLVKDKYIPIEDPYFKDSPKEIKDELLAYWRPRLGYCSKEIAKHTLLNTTQHVLLLEADTRQIPRNTMASRNPQSNPRRTNEIVYTDTAFADCVSLGGKKCFQLLTTAVSLYTRVYPLRAKKQAHLGVKEFSRYEAIMNHLHHDNAPELTQGKLKEFCQLHAIRQTTTGGRDKPNQNRCENKIGTIKDIATLIMQEGRAPPNTWNYAVQHAADIWNHRAHALLLFRTPAELFTGKVVDISPYKYTFWQRIRYMYGPAQFPSTNMRIE